MVKKFPHLKKTVIPHGVDKNFMLTKKLKENQCIQRINTFCMYQE